MEKVNVICLGWLQLHLFKYENIKQRTAAECKRYINI